MKYRKRNMGGSDITAPLQPNKPLQPKSLQPTKPLQSVSHEPSISDSVRGSYTDFKIYYTSIITYIKTNFVFCLIVGILLIVYIYFFSTDPVTEEDIQGELSTITCKSYEIPCDPGKKRVDDVECVDDACSDDICCIDDVSCTSYRGSCLPGYRLRTENDCATEECKASDCCVKDCSDFTETSCGETTINNPDNFCETDQCGPNDCCDDIRTCGASDDGSPARPFDCGHGKRLQGSPGSITCLVGGCDESTCCNDMCESYSCMTGSLKTNSLTLDCLTGGCDDETCCDPVEESVNCGSYSCDNNYTLQSGSSSIMCSDGGGDDGDDDAGSADGTEGSCTNELCCELQNCASYTCSSGDPKLHAGSITCLPDGVCSDPLCCN